MRNPHHSVISHFNKEKCSFDALYNVIGYEALYQIYQKVARDAINKPLLILTEDLYEHPEETIRTLCANLDIPFIPEALNWSKLDSSFDAHKEWHELKFPEGTNYWHEEAFQSSGFTKPKSYAVDANGQPTFEEIEDPDHRAFYMKVYQHNLPYYQLMLKYVR